MRITKELIAMGKSFLLILFLSFLSLGKVFSQVTNHPTIQSVKIMYWPYKRIVERDNPATIPVIAMATSTTSSSPPIPVKKETPTPVLTTSLNPAADKNLLHSVVSEVVIVLKNATDVSKIYLNIYQTDSKTPFYQTVYAIASQTETKSAEGIKVYYTKSEEIHISNPNAVFLKPYKYEIITENSSKVQSSPYLITN